jgi:hypothetical protein
VYKTLARAEEAFRLKYLDDAHDLWNVEVDQGGGGA